MGQHKLIERICAACGRKFLARSSDLRPNRGRACSFRCSGRLRGQKLPARPEIPGARLSQTDLAAGTYHVCANNEAVKGE